MLLFLPLFLVRRFQVTCLVRGHSALFPWFFSALIIIIIVIDIIITVIFFFILIISIIIVFIIVIIFFSFFSRCNVCSLVPSCPVVHNPLHGLTELFHFRQTCLKICRIFSLLTWFSPLLPGRCWASALKQCFSTAGPRPSTEPWHQLYRAVSGLRKLQYATRFH